MSREKIEFSIRLAEARMRLGFADDKKMAAALGIPQATLSGYMNREEMPKNIRANLLIELSNRGVDLRWLLTGANGTPQNAAGRSSGSEPYGDEGRGIDALAARIVALKRDLAISKSREGNQTPIAWDRALEIVLQGILPEENQEAARRTILRLAGKEQEEPIQAEKASS